MFLIAVGCLETVSARGKISLMLNQQSVSEPQKALETLAFSLPAYASP
jgi:hypothetical protein